MHDEMEFHGFPVQAPGFFASLAANNRKDWFEAHKAEYEGLVRAPARRFIAAMGELLTRVRPGIVADPRVNKSLFRINRDTRFAADKTPYKDHLGIWFWQGEGPRMESSGLYLQLDAQGLMLAAGLYQFPRSLLAAYRAAAVHPRRGEALAEAAAAVAAAGYQVGGQHYKRLPGGVAADHPNAELLKHDGLYAMWRAEPHPAELFDDRVLDLCLEHWLAMLPLHDWLVDMIARAGS